MKIATNKKLISRNSRIGQITSIGALVILAFGMYITFKIPEKVGYSLGALIFGFFLSQIGMYYGNRWGRKPRPDEILNKALKGLGREYSIYHYLTPARHLLLGPAGIWVIIHYYQAGTIAYSNKRWKQKGGGFIQGYLKLFGQENIGRPELEVSAEITSLAKFLKRNISDFEVPEIKPVAIFSNPNINLVESDFPLPVLTPVNFKEFLKQNVKKDITTQIKLKQIQDLLPAADSQKE